MICVVAQKPCVAAKMLLTVFTVVHYRLLNKVFFLELRYYLLTILPTHDLLFY